ncbi:MAG: Transcriptional regulator TrmB [Candidatus Magasanikbacteria bacterium GW2011_GWC2_37_14]|uniref:Transcriptional regulator TrmB n=1 Tax=Candidatus Magasanikbacteria bacterium GW2011_GWC2_37_14 TaxID=1619046 RepID=A0A0G0ITJ8_9BACT|nr:MAG: Transcriptional regulator TrmB [Candidatus Magasanikbacteria bacterium GW2011_GWC2_37_14]
MYSQILTELGLSINEAKIYETLLQEKQTTVSNISKKSKIHRRNIYDSMNRLIEKGLVFQVIGNGDTLFKPVEPAKLMELVDEKRTRLEKEMPHLMREYQKHPAMEAAYIYKGIEGFKNYLRDMLSVNEDAYFIGAKGAWFDPRLQTFLDKFLIDAKKRGIKYYHLFDHEVKNMAPHVPKAVGKPFKFLPKQYSTPSMVDIFGDHVVSFTGAGITKISDDITIFVNISRPLATSYKTWFKFMWDHCPETK